MQIWVFDFSRPPAPRPRRASAHIPAFIPALILALILGQIPGQAPAQQVCQPLQGTSAHATCLNEQLSRSLNSDHTDPPATPPVSPDLNLNRRDSAPVPTYDPGFAAAQSANQRRLQQSTQARQRALSGSVTQSLSPRISVPFNQRP